MVLLSCKIKSFDFIVSTVTIKFVSGSMVTLSEKLQKKTSDLLSVCEMIQDLKRMFNYVLADNEKNTFNDIFRQACKIADENFIVRCSRNLCLNLMDEDVKTHFYNVF